MGFHHIRGAVTFFAAYAGGLLSESVFYAGPTEVGIDAGNGRKIYLHGEGMVWDQSTGRLTAGIVTGIAQYLDGTYVDSLDGINFDASFVQDSFEAAEDIEGFRAALLSGNDIIDARYRLGDGPNRLIGYAGNDKILGDGGNDELWGYSGRDTVYGGSGDDFINGGGDDDWLLGQSGSDRIIGDGGSDRMNGGAGDDAIFGGAGNDIYLGGDGLDTAVYARLLDELIITISPTSFKIIEPNGQDRLQFIERLGTDDGIFTYNFETSAWERISLLPGMALINPDQWQLGTVGDDTINLEGTNKTIYLGLAGDDTIRGAGGNDTIRGGTGNDDISGDVDSLSFKTFSIDRLIGEEGDDTISGLGGDDYLYGGAGADDLFGGNGNDLLVGGAGADTFHFRYSTDRFINESWGNDVISDFTVGTDKIALVFGPFALPGGPTSFTPDLADTAAGWMLSYNGGSILLKGLHTAGLTLGDILA
jgi:Ca2+-binding RTX toxin-like protein